jgi:cellulose 1,4-beta-cellobiosidase
MAKVPKIAEFVADVKKKGGNQVIPLVVYDLPERDCSALASNGELSLADGGEAKYKDYIAAIKKEIVAAGTAQKFILVIGKFHHPNDSTPANVTKSRTRFTCQPCHEHERAKMPTRCRCI